MAYDATILAEASLTAYYTLDSDGTDSKGSFTGTVTGGSFANVGGCVDGSKCWTTTGAGTEQIVATGDPLPSSGDFAIEFAMKATAAASAELIWVADATTWQDGVYLRNTNEIDSRNNGTPTSSGPTLSDANWHLYQVSYKASTTEIKWYKDGALATTTTTVMSTGARSNSGFVRTTNGVAMRVQKGAFYNAQLSQAQVTAHWNAYSIVNDILSGTGATVAVTGGSAGLQVNTPLFAVGAQIGVTGGNAGLQIDAPIHGTGAQVAVTGGNAALVVNNPLFAAGAQLAVLGGAARLFVGGGGGDTGGTDIVGGDQSSVYGIIGDQD